MATVNALSSFIDRARIKLVRNYDPKKIRYEVLTRKVEEEKRTAKVAAIDGKNPEIMLTAIIDFFDACEDEILKLSTGPLCFQYFRTLLSDNIKATWDGIRNGKPTSKDSFLACVKELIGNKIRASDLHDQKKYLDNASKPFRMSVEDLADRLVRINALSAWFPGSNQHKLYNDVEMKRLLHGMMLGEWQLNFNQTTHRLEDNAYTYNMVRDYYVDQEEVWNAKKEAQRRRNHRYGQFPPDAPSPPDPRRTPPTYAYGVPPSSGNDSYGNIQSPSSSGSSGGPVRRRGYQGPRPNWQPYHNRDVARATTYGPSRFGGSPQGGRGYYSGGRGRSPQGRGRGPRRGRGYGRPYHNRTYYHQPYNQYDAHFQGPPPAEAYHYETPQQGEPSYETYDAQHIDTNQDDTDHWLNDTDNFQVDQEDQQGDDTHLTQEEEQDQEDEHPQDKQY